VLDAGMVPGQQHLGNPHAAELGRARELWAPGQLTTERVLGQRTGIADYAGDEARHHVDHDHGRDLASAEHVVADRDLTGRQAGAHPVVDPLVPPAHDDQARLARQVGGDPLVEALAPRLEQDHRPGVVEHHALDRLEHRLRLHHHSGPASKRHVVDLAVAVVSEVAEVVGVQLEQPAPDGATQHSLPERGQEHDRKDGHDVEPHPASSTCRSQSATATRPASRSTLTTASLVAGMRYSTDPSRLTQTSLAGRSSTSSMRPMPTPDTELTDSPTTWW